MKKGWIALLVFLCCSGSAIQAADKLRVYNDNNPQEPVISTSNYQEIAAVLNSIGVRFEKWETNQVLPKDADQETVINAYRENVDQLVQENGYQSIDVARIFPNNPKKVEFRNKFLNEHSHTEDEVRLFVEGSGLFYLHLEGKVFIALCEKGDLISIPANYNHWFDMGAEPYFTAIRFFINSDGWIPAFTGNPIADYFPKYGD